MRGHLKDLSSRDYKQAIISDLRFSEKVNHVSTIMFLPSESAIEKLQQYDEEFLQKSWQQNIYPAGPIGLMNILAHAKFQIYEEKKEKNYQIIIEEVKNLISNVANLSEHARKLGSSLHNASSHYDKFAASFNKNILSKAKRISKLGVEPKQNKEIPDSLGRFHIIQAEKLTFIEGEVEVGEKEEEEVF
jgi:DNA recombination protein RmuC